MSSRNIAFHCIQLEPGKFANTKGFEGRAKAEAEITDSLARAKGTSFE